MKLVEKILRRLHKRSLFTQCILRSIHHSFFTKALRFLLEGEAKEEMLDYAMFWAARAELNGDYLEFGVYDGLSFAEAFYYAQQWKLNCMKFYAFDSFEGLPSVKGVDAEGFREAEFKEGATRCSVERFRSMISRKGVDLSRVIITPGWYNEVLNEETKKKLEIKSASVVFIDCDLYESTVPVLDFITDYLRDGTLLMLVEWFHFRGNPDRGQQRATREWLEKNPDIKLTEFRKFRWMGCSFIVHRGE